MNYIIINESIFMNPDGSVDQYNIDILNLITMQSGSSVILIGEDNRFKKIIKDYRYSVKMQKINGLNLGSQTVCSILSENKDIHAYCVIDNEDTYYSWINKVIIRNNEIFYKYLEIIISFLMEVSEENPFNKDYDWFKNLIDLNKIIPSYPENDLLMYSSQHDLYYKKEDLINVIKSCNNMIREVGNILIENYKNGDICGKKSI